MKILFLGDIVGKTGCVAVVKNLPEQIKKRKIDFVIANGENAAKEGVELLKEFELTEYIDFSVTSYEAGSEKPHPPIFEEALRRALVTSNEVFHVGDQIGSDIEGAENANIAPILMDRDSNYDDWDLIRCPRVSNMLELEMTLNDFGRKTL